MPYATGPGYGSTAYASVTLDVEVRLAAGDTVTAQASSAAAVNLLGGTAGYGQT